MKSIFTVSIALFSLSAFSMDSCPVNFSDSDFTGKVSVLATKSASCSEASEIVKACALGNSQDIQTVQAAISRCNKGVKLNATDKQIYTYLNNKCSDKFDSLEGTMYRSMSAFCNLSVTTLFTDLLSNDNL